MSEPQETESDRGSKLFESSTFSMPGPVREDLGEMREATVASETVLVIARGGTSYRVVPREDRDDYISVWGVSDRENPPGYARFKALGDAEKDTVPLRLLGRLFLARVVDLIRSVDTGTSQTEGDSQ